GGGRQLDDLRPGPRQSNAGLEAMKAVAEKALAQLTDNSSPGMGSGDDQGAGSWLAAVVDFLATWQAGASSEDCSLPELYHHAKKTHPPLTTAHFHDRLRRLHP